MFEQVKLPYAFTDLEPHIDGATMEVHYTGHHATYTKNLNDLAEKIPALKGSAIEEILLNLEALPQEHRTAVANNGGGFLAHNLYFESLSPHGGKEPTGALKTQIDKDFGNFQNLKEALTQAALTQFGSGYAWLVYCKKSNMLKVEKTPNQDLPLKDTTVLLPIDVWEHAYYLKHKNKRASHIEDLFHVIDWSVVEKRYG